MGDMKEFFKDLNRRSKDARVMRREINIAIMQKSSLTYKDNGVSLLFRDENKPKVDFYPGTGRWKVHNVVYKGGADKFIEWYRDQNTILQQI